MKNYFNRFVLLRLSLILQTSATLLLAQTPSSRDTVEPKRDSGVTAWLKQHAITIKSVEAGNGFDDLQPLKRVLADVRVVGLGEATHGTREFFQFKHRMVEF